MYAIKEVAKLLNISKESIYKKIQKSLQTELQSHIFKTSKGTLIDDIGVEIIKNSLKDTNFNKEKTPFVTDFVSDNVNYNQLQNTDFISILKQQLEEKDKQIVSLIQLNNELLQSKEKEIQSLLELNKQLIELNRNNQILLKTEQEKNLLENKKDVEIVKTESENINFKEIKQPTKKQTELKSDEKKILTDEEVVELIKKGYSFRKIAKEYGVGQARISSLKKKFKL